MSMTKAEEQAIDIVDNYINFMNGKTIKPESVKVTELQAKALRKKLNLQKTEPLAYYNGYRVEVHK